MESFVARMETPVGKDWGRVAEMSCRVGDNAENEWPGMAVDRRKVGLGR